MFFLAMKMKDIIINTTNVVVPFRKIFLEIPIPTEEILCLRCNSLFYLTTSKDTSDSLCLCCYNNLVRGPVPADPLETNFFHIYNWGYYYPQFFLGYDSAFTLIPQ